MRWPQPVSTLFILGVMPLLHCGARTTLDDGVPPADAALPEASPRDAPAPDAAAPDAPPTFDASVPDASTAACTPAPPGGLMVGGFPTDVLSMGIAVVGPTIYAATTSNVDTSALYAGALFTAPSTGGATRPLAAPAFNFGNIVSDGTQLYYVQSSGMAEGPTSAIYTTLGLAAIDLATGAIRTFGAVEPPRSESSMLDSYMVAATAAHPGVFWIGAPNGEATTLYASDPATQVVTTIATGQALSGLAVDASGVYWADTGGGTGISVYRSPLTGGATSLLASVPGGKYGVLLGVSSDDVVFVSDYATGSIETVSKAGGPVAHLVNTSFAWVNALAWVDDHELYWTANADQTVLRRIPVAGGAQEVVPTTGDIEWVAFDACNVYIATSAVSGEVLVRPK